MPVKGRVAIGDEQLISANSADSLKVLGCSLYGWMI
jgi:hypothetical protein